MLRRTVLVRSTKQLLKSQLSTHLPHRLSLLTTTASAFTRGFHNSYTRYQLTEEQLAILNEERAVDTVDVCIVGGGPAGLTTAIKLKQLDNEKGSGELRVVVLEKAGDFGSHIVSGAVIEPRAFLELFPEDELTKEHGIPLPVEMAIRFPKDRRGF